MTAVLVECAQRFSVQPRAVFGEAAENDVCDSPRRLQRADHGADRNARRPIGRETVDAGGDGGKGDRRQAMRLAELQRAAIA
jgi:hypothetical protein